MNLQTKAAPDLSLPSETEKSKQALLERSQTDNGINVEMVRPTQMLNQA